MLNPDLFRLSESIDYEIVTGFCNGIKPIVNGIIVSKFLANKSSLNSLSIYFEVLRFSFANCETKLTSFRVGFRI